MNLGLIDAKDKSKNGQTIDFQCDIESAIEFYSYLHSCGTNSAKLVIDVEYDTRGFVSSRAILN